MGILAKNATFLVGLVIVAGLSVGSLALWQASTVGAETDVPVDSSSDTWTGTIIQGQGSPPQAPVETGGPSSTGAVDSSANTLPSTGSGGYLESGSNSLAYALAVIAAAFAMTGSFVFARARK